MPRRNAYVMIAGEFPLDAAREFAQSARAAGFSPTVRQFDEALLLIALDNPIVHTPDAADMNPSTYQKALTRTEQKRQLVFSAAGWPSGGVHTILITADLADRLRQPENAKKLQVFLEYTHTCRVNRCTPGRENDPVLIRAAELHAQEAVPAR